MEKKTSSIKTFCQKHKVEFLLFFSVFVIKLILNIFIKSRTLATGNDDIGTIASAAFFAGLDWSSVISQTLYYGWGYAMLMAPAFMITDNVYIIIQIMLGYNAALLAGSVVLAYIILHKIWKIADKKYCALAALASNCFFFALIDNNILYNETAIIFLTWLLLYITLKLQYNQQQKKPVWGWTLALVLCLSYGMTIHTRFIFAWGGIAVLLLVYAMLYKKFLGNIWIMLVGLPVGYVVSSKLSAWMQDVLWKANEKEVPLTNTMDSVSGKWENISNFASAEGITGFLEGCLGQGTVMYLLSGGILTIFIVLTVLAIRKFFQRVCSKKKVAVFAEEDVAVDSQILISIIFIAAILIATLLFTNIAALPVLKRAIEKDWVTKWFVYSRYWGAICPMGMLLTFAWLKKCKDKELVKRVWIASGILMAATMALFAIFVAPRLIGGKISSALVFQVLLGPTFSAFEARFGVQSFVFLLVFGGIWFLLLWLLYSKGQMYKAAVVTMVCGIYIFGYKMVAADIPLAEASYQQFEPVEKVLEQYGLTTDLYSRIYVDSEMDDFYNAQLRLNRYQLIVRDYEDYSMNNTKDVPEYEGIQIALTDRIGEEMCGYWSILHEEYGINEDGVEEIVYYVLIRNGALVEQLKNEGAKLQDIAAIYNMEKLIYQSDESKIRDVGIHKIGNEDVLEQDFYITSSMLKADTAAFAFMFKNPTLTPSDGKVLFTISQGSVKKTYFVTMDNIVTREKFYILMDMASFRKGKATLTVTCEEAQQFRYIIPYIVPFDSWEGKLEGELPEELQEGVLTEENFEQEMEQLIQGETVPEEKKGKEEEYPIRFNGEKIEAELYMQIFLPGNTSELYTGAISYTDVSSKDAQMTLGALENGQVFSQRFRISQKMLKQKYFGMEFLVRNFNPGQDSGKFSIKLKTGDITKVFEVPATELLEKDYLRITMESKEILAGIAKVEISYVGEAGMGYPKFYSLKPSKAEMPDWILGRLYRDEKKTKHYLYMNLFGGVNDYSMEKYSW